MMNPSATVENSKFSLRKNQVYMKIVPHVSVREYSKQT